MMTNEENDDNDLIKIHDENIELTGFDILDSFDSDTTKPKKDLDVAILGIEEL